MRLRSTVGTAIVSMTVAGLMVATPVAPAGAAVSLPAGFLLEDIPTGMRPPTASDQGDLLTDFAFLPDESIIATGKYGKVTWIPKTGAPRQIANLPIVGAQDLGLLGIAIAPDFATSRTVYTARSAPASGPGSGEYGVLRLSRWTVATDAAGNPTGLGNEQTVLQTSADHLVHGISTVIADEDGTLWVSIGDSADFISVDPRALRSLDLNDLHGKLLHVHADGTGVPGNPYFEAANPNSVRSKVYASGFRSPFRFSIDPATNRPVLGDVGWNAYEEVDLVSPGNDYGWPCWEGNQRTPGYRDLPGCSGVNSVSPLWTYPRPSGSSVTGGVIYNGANYPVEYRGRYFFGDYTSHRLWTMAFDSAGKVTTAPTDPGFGVDIGLPAKFAAMPTGGDIVFADIGSATLRRLVYAPGNNAPIAAITSTNDPATRTVAFSGDKSWDPNGDELSYQWDFGDGTTGSGLSVSHTYAASPQSFSATLTVTDPLGKSGSATVTVFPANHAPALVLHPPDPQRTFAVGDLITATATATDQEDGSLEVNWTTDTVHCRGASACHSHPGVRMESTSEFELAFEGHPGDTRLEITAVVTDSRGAQASQTFVAKPRQRRVTVQSNTPAEFTIGDEQGNSGLFTVGQNLTVIAPEAAADQVATFDRWADGAARVRNQVVPDADVTLQVNYLTPIDRRYQGDIAAFLGAPVEVEQGDARVRWREYQHGRLYWSPETDVHLVAGAILSRYVTAGGHQEMGVPATDELAAPDGRGRYNEFTGGRSIYWTPQTGAHIVWGGIYTKWRQLGGEVFNGYPLTDELPTPDGVGRYNHFEGGSIYWHPATGAYEVHGRIRDRWESFGWEKSHLGYPRTDETSTPDGVGRYNHFQGGSVYWHPSTGAYEVRGSIRDRWAALGWERSYLGYPTSNEFDVPGGRRSNFQHGYVIFQWSTGRATDHRY